MMTMERAGIRARIIWGKDGYVRIDPPRHYRNGQPRPTHAVGKLSHHGFSCFMIEGSGFSFDEAFADYERKRRWDRMGEQRERMFDLLKRARVFVDSMVLNYPDAAASGSGLDQDLERLLDEIENGADA